MSWSIKAKGAPQQVLDAVKADPGVENMPDALPLLIEDLVSKTQGTVELATNGHVFEGIGEVHLTISQAAAEAAPEPA
jgi:hypothetical protein